MGRAEGGQIKNGQKVLVMPAAVQGQAKSISVHGEPADWAQAGDHVTLSLHGLDMVNITYVYITKSITYTFLVQHEHVHRKKVFVVIFGTLTYASVIVILVGYTNEIWTFRAAGSIEPFIRN